jgi:aspartyl-tRNA(Asn)/glutamyl-tRNA(Gln) amidotransferase subunit C
MHITTSDVYKIATLARLEIDEKQATVFAAQLDTILAYMDTLNGLDTSAIEPMYSPVNHATVLREDETTQHYDSEEILHNAPEKDGGYFIVPKIV